MAARAGSDRVLWRTFPPLLLFKFIYGSQQWPLGENINIMSSVPMASWGQGY